MYAKENPQCLVQLRPCLDLVQAVVLFLCTKASFYPGYSLFAQLLSNDLPVILMFACPAFSFEVGGNLLTGTVLPVSIGGIDIICRDVGDLSKKCPAVPD